MVRYALAALLTAGAAWGAGPGAVFTEAQWPQVVRRKALCVEADRAWKAGKQERAITCLEEALALSVRLLGPYHRDVDHIADWLGECRKDREEWEKEAACRAQAVSARARLYGPDHWMTIDARQVWREALEQPKRTRARREALRQAFTLSQRAANFSRSGQMAQAVPLLKKAVAIYKDASGRPHYLLDVALNNLGYAADVLGDYRTALPAHKEALALRKQLLGEKHPRYATSLNNLGLLYFHMGDRKAALPLFQKALAVRHEVLGERDPAYATSLNNLATLYQARGDNEAAERLFRRSLIITKATRGEGHPEYAGSLNNLAVLYLNMAEYRKALPLLQKAAALYKAKAGPKHPDYASSLTNLGWAALAVGDLSRAQSHYKEAEAATREGLGERHPRYARVLEHLAVLHQKKGELEKARALFEKAVGLTFAHLRDAAAVQSDRQQLAALGAFRSRLDARVSLGDGDCYAHVLSWKGSVLLRQRQRRLFTALASSPQTRKLALALRETTRRIAALSTSSAPRPELLQKLTAEQERLQGELSRLSSVASGLKSLPPAPKALADALPEGAALVDYLVYWRHDVKARGGAPSRERHLAAFVSRKGKPAVRIDLGLAGKAEALAKAFRLRVTRGHPCGASGGQLKKAVWSPLEKHLEGAKVVLVSPDGALGWVPFSALPGAKPGTYLIEDVALATVPVPQLLPEMLKRRGPAERLKPSLLLVGDVDYNRAGADRPAAGADERGAPVGLSRAWTRLPATYAEVGAVSRAFSRLFRTGTTTDLSRGEATRKAVCEALPRVRYAHLATHGFFAPEVAKSALGQEGAAGWHPLLLSGVVLAGANREPKAGEQDGILTALEVSELELPKLELVVLSACETGLGQQAGGEGLLGLQRAFQVAGARAVVASLWKVDDRATQQLMTHFYRAAWAPKTIVSRAEALRQAQLSMLREGRRRGVGKKPEKLPAGKKEDARLPPYYWAAFVLSGDWR